MACGYEQPIDGAAGWQHPADRGPAPSCCPGYLIRQPDVVAVSRLKMHWDRGADVGDPRARRLLEEMALAADSAQAFAMREAAKRAKRES